MLTNRRTIEFFVYVAAIALIYCFIQIWGTQ